LNDVPAVALTRHAFDARSSETIRQLDRESKDDEHRNRQQPWIGAEDEVRHEEIRLAAAGF
jgi:hypothetical protein